VIVSHHTALHISPVQYIKILNANAKANKCYLFSHPLLFLDPSYLIESLSSLVPESKGSQRSTVVQQLKLAKAQTHKKYDKIELYSLTIIGNVFQIY
jgi:hypothetical protein